MREAKDITVNVRGLRLAAKVWGKNGGHDTTFLTDGTLPIFAVHGWLDNANSFDFLAPLLPNHTIVAVDLPGHGASQHRSQDAAYHFIDYAVDMIDVANQLGWERFIYVGHSLGAAIGMLIAGAFPERITHNIWLDAIGPFTAEADTMPQRLARHMREEQRGRERQPRALPSVEKAVELLRGVVPKLSARSANAIVARNTRVTDEGVMWTYDARLRGTSSSRLTEAQCLTFLQRITAPTLFLRAVDGMAFDAHETQLRERAVPHLRKIEMVGGHHLHMEMPQEAARHIETFLRDV